MYEFMEPKALSGLLPKRKLEMTLRTSANSSTVLGMEAHPLSSSSAYSSKNYCGSKGLLNSSCTPFSYFCSFIYTRAYFTSISSSKILGSSSIFFSGSPKSKGFWALASSDYSFSNKSFSPEFIFINIFFYWM